MYDLTIANDHFFMNFIEFLYLCNKFPTVHQEDLQAYRTIQDFNYS